MGGLFFFRLFSHIFVPLAVGLNTHIRILSNKFVKTLTYS